MVWQLSRQNNHESSWIISYYIRVHQIQLHFVALCTADRRKLMEVSLRLDLTVWERVSQWTKKGPSGWYTLLGLGRWVWKDDTLAAILCCHWLGWHWNNCLLPGGIAFPWTQVKTSTCDHPDPLSEPRAAASIRLSIPQHVVQSWSFAILHKRCVLFWPRFLRAKQYVVLLQARAQWKWCIGATSCSCTGALTRMQIGLWARLFF